MVGSLKIDRYDSDKIFLVKFTDFNDEIKEYIRRHFVSMCVGPENAIEHADIHDYKSTLRYFLEVVEKKDTNKKKGIVGEMISHTFIPLVDDSISQASPFLNLEEKSFSKGMDILFFNTTDKKIEYCEVKSGSSKKNRVTSKANSNVSAAHSDFQKKFTGLSEQPWRNALNKCDFNNKEGKDTIVSLLKKRLKSVQNKKDLSTENANALISSVVYENIEENIDISRIRSKYSDIKDHYSDICIFNFHKESFELVLSFLVEESKK